MGLTRRLRPRRRPLALLALAVAAALGSSVTAFVTAPPVVQNPSRSSKRVAASAAGPEAGPSVDTVKLGKPVPGAPEDGESGLPAQEPEPSKAETAGAPPLLSTLWEQWGLLGLLVGLAVALSSSGLFEGDVDLVDFDFDDAEVFWPTFLASFQASFGWLSSLWSPDEELGAAGASSAAEGLAAVSEAAPPELVSQAVQETTAAEAAGAAVATEAVAAEGLIGTAIAVRAAIAASFAALGGYLGLLAEASQEPTRERQNTGYIVPSAQFVPGTIRSRTDEQKEQGRDDRPMSAWALAMYTFKLELKQLFQAARLGGKTPRRHIPSFVSSLVLSNEAVITREKIRPEVPTPLPVRVAYDVLCWFIDVVFEDRPIQRFWFLETVARMPYFAYTSVLHLYETLGWWRSPELRAVHAAEEDNELHHLLIMESLGGDQRWLDRFLAQHGAIFYYWILVLFFIYDPRWSYNFSRLIESHAIDTYGEFVDANQEQLKKIPPPPIAVEYYLSSDLFLFDKFQTARYGMEPRRPPCSTLYDVFSNIRDDEEQHVLTMNACEEWVVGGPPAVPLGYNRLSEEEYELKVTSKPEGREAWLAWGREVAQAAKEAGRQVKRD